MRRWVCFVALLAGFAGQGYVWLARPRTPVPIERLIDDSASDLPYSDWWHLS